MKNGFGYTRWIAAFLMVVYLTNPFKILLPYLSYNLNYEYISQVLCINKNKPTLQCEGKCHLKKEIEKTKESETRNQSISVELAVEEIPAPGLMLEIPFQVKAITANTQQLASNYTPNTPGKTTPPPRS